MLSLITVLVDKLIPAFYLYNFTHTHADIPTLTLSNNPGPAPMSSSITDLEFQTFYVVTKLLDAVYPNGKLYVSHGLSTDRDSYRYRAAVVESKIESSGSVKRRLLSQVETAKTRIGVLEAVRKRLEEIASWRLDVIISDKERDDVEENERKRKNLVSCEAAYEEARRRAESGTGLVSAAGEALTMEDIAREIGVEFILQKPW